MVLTLGLLSCLFFAIFGPANADLSRTCRCLPGDSCFPGVELWSIFDQRVGGRLVEVRPPAFPCYTNGLASNECSQIRSNWHSSVWRSGQPGASEHPNWERYNDQGCNLPNLDDNVQFSISNCTQGSVPVFAVNVSSYHDVQAAIDFARAYNIRLVVKNTGHDYMGKSNARGSLSIWTHNLKDISFHTHFHERFGGKHDVSPNWTTGGVTAVTVGAGVQTMELVEAADQQGVIVVTALSASVGPAGGYFQGGGHSVLSPTYGLAADNAIEFTIVTPDGVLRIANRHRNPDLFWAVRGGGGGTFGVVISVTFLTHPAPKNFLAAEYVISSDDHESFRSLLEELAAVSPSLSDLGWGGYFTAIYEARNPVLVMRYVIPNQNLGFAASTFGPLLTFVQASSNLHVISEIEASHGTYLQFYQDFLCAFYGSNNCVDRVGINRSLITRLVPRSTMEQSAGQLASALVDLLSSNATTDMILGIHVGGGAVANRHNNSVNAAWRDTIWHMTAEANWNDSATESEIQTTMAGLTVANAAMRELTPDSGAYVNEADYNEPNWQQALFGDRYERLLAVKRAVDPDHLFTCWHCVGSEYSPTGGCGYSAAPSP